MADELSVKVQVVVDTSAKCLNTFTAELNKTLAALPDSKLPKIAVQLDKARTKRLFETQLQELAKGMQLQSVSNAGATTNKSTASSGPAAAQKQAMQIATVKAQAQDLYTRIQKWQSKVKPIAFVDESQNAALSHLLETVQQAASTGDRFSLRQANNEFKELRANIKNLDMENRNTLQHVSEKLTGFASYFIGSGIVLGFADQLRQGVQAVKDLDKALTVINMTMPVTERGMAEIADKSLDMARELGMGVNDLLGVAQIYANMQETVDRMLEKSKPTVMLSTAAEISGSEAADTIQAALNQFDLDESEAMHVTDVFEKVSASMKMEFGKGIREINEGIKNSGAIAKEAGYDMESYVAMLGNITETIRDGSKVSNALKMIFSRIGGAKTGDATAEDVSNAEKAYKSVGVAIRDANGEFRKTSDILDDLYAKWDKLTSVQRSYIAEASAGNRNRSVFLTMMDRYDNQQELTETAYGADGFAEEVQAKYVQSIEAKINSLKATMADMWTGLISSDTIKFLADLANSLVQLLNIGDGIVIKIGLVIGLLPTLLGLLRTLKGLTVIKEIAASFGILDGAIQKAGLSMRAFLLTNPEVAAILLALGAIVTVVNSIDAANQQALASARELSEQYAGKMQTHIDNIQTLSELEERYNELSTDVGEGNQGILSNDEYKEYLSLLEQIHEINPSIVKGYNEQGEAIADKTKKIQDLIDAEKEQAETEKLQLVASQSAVGQNVLDDLNEIHYGKKYEDNPFTGAFWQQYFDSGYWKHLGSDIGLYVDTDTISGINKQIEIDEIKLKYATDAEQIAQLNTEIDTLKNKLSTLNQQTKAAAQPMHDLLAAAAETSDVYQTLNDDQKAVIDSYVQNKSGIWQSGEEEVKRLYDLIDQIKDTPDSGLSNFILTKQEVDEGRANVQELLDAYEAFTQQYYDSIKDENGNIKQEHWEDLGLESFKDESGKVSDEIIKERIAMRFGMDTETLDALKESLGDLNDGLGRFKLDVLKQLAHYINSIEDEDSRAAQLESLKTILAELPEDKAAELSDLFAGLDETSILSVQQFNSGLHSLFSEILQDAPEAADKLRAVMTAFANDGSEVETGEEQWQKALNMVNTYAEEIQELSTVFATLAKGDKADFSTVMKLLEASPELASAIEVENGVLQLNADAIGKLMLLKEQQFKRDLELKQAEAEATKADLEVKLYAIEAQMYSRGLLSEVTATTTAAELEASGYSAQAAADWASVTTSAQGGVIEGWLTVGDATAWAAGQSNNQLIAQRTLINQSLAAIQRATYGIDKLRTVNFPKSLSMGGSNGSGTDLDDYNKKVADIQDELLKKEQDAADKLKELDEKGSLDRLKHEIEAAKLQIEQLSNVLDDLDLKLELTFEGDFASRMDVLAAKLDTATQKGILLRAEFERLAAITPQNADEAETLASRLDDLGGEIRDNLKEIVQYRGELDRLRISAATTSADNAVSALQNEISRLDSDRKRLTEGSLFGRQSAFGLDFLLPVIPETAIQRQRSENDELIAEQQRYEDEIQRIKEESLRLQAEENARAREEQRAQILADLEEARQSAVEQLQDLTDKASSSAAAIGAAFDSISSTYKHNISELTATYLSDLDGLTRTEYERLLSSLQQNYLDPSSELYDEWLDGNLEKIVEKSGDKEFRENFSTLLGIQDEFFNTWSINDQREFPKLANEIVEYLLNPTEGEAEETYNKNLIEIFKRYCLTSDTEQAKKYGEDIKKLSRHNSEVTAAIDTQIEELSKKTLPTPEIKTEDWMRRGEEAGKAFAEGVKNIPVTITGFLKGVFSGEGGAEGGNVSAKSVAEYFGGTITSGFGYRNDPFTGTRKLHNGIDIGLNYGTNVRAPVGGTVIFAGWDTTGYGNCVKVRTPDGQTQLFGHMSAILVSKGQSINANDIVGLVGSTGNSTGPHLHFGTYDANGKAYNPSVLLYARAAGGTVGKGELTLVGDGKKGKSGTARELGILPNGRVVLLGAKRAELVDLPAGTKIIPNEETEQILQHTSNSLFDRPIPKLADGNVTVTTAAPDADDVTVQADNVTVNASEAELKADEVADWIKRYTELPQAYSEAFLLAYRTYANERLGRIGDINSLKQSSPAQARRLSDELLIADLYQSANMQQDAYYETADRLTQAYNDLLWEFNQLEDTADPAVLSEYVQGLSKIQQSMEDLDEQWRKSGESIRQSIESVYALITQPLDNIATKADLAVESLEHALSMTNDYGEQMDIYDQLISVSQEKADAQAAKRDAAHSLADALRAENADILGMFDTEGWFDAAGNLTKQFQEDLDAVADPELAARMNVFAQSMSAYKQSWVEANQAGMDAEKAAYEYINAKVEKQTAAYQKMYDKVLEMIERNYQQEKEMLEAAHENRLKQLDEEKEAIEDTYSRQLELLDEMKNSEDYQRNLAEEQETADKLQARIDLLSLDTSDAARLQRLTLEKQLAEQKDKIAKMQRDHEFDETKKALQKDKELQDEHIEELKDAEDEHYDKLTEDLELRYSQANRYAMATEALATGTLGVISAKGIETYQDIEDKGKATAMSLQEAYDILATESGEKFAGMGVEFENMNHMLREAISLSEQLANSGAFAYLTSQNEFTSSTIVGKDNGAITQPDRDKQTNIGNWATGNNGDEALAGHTYGQNEAMLRQSAAYRASELSRAMTVIDNRIAEGMDTGEQKQYLKHVIDLIREFGDKVAGLDSIVAQYGLAYYHTGKEEQLAVILDDEAILTAAQQQSILERFADLTAFSGSVAELVRGQLYHLRSGLTPTPSFAMGDVNIHIAGNADASTVRALRKEGGSIRAALGKELQRYLGVK